MANVQHISTGYIYPQFHLFFDDLLYMVICQGDDESTIEAIFSNIFISINIGPPKNSLTILVIAFIGRHPFMMSC